MSDKYISRDNLELAIDGLKVGMTPNWNENDKNASGYIENKPFYTEYGVIVDNYSGSGKRPKCNFVVGNVYDVIWNGVTYKGLVCHTDGEYNSIGGDGYPFYIDNDGGNGFYVAPESGFTVSILGDIVHQLDEKYIPDDIARVEDVEEVFTSFADSFDESINNLETTLNNKISTNTTNITTNRNNISALTTKVNKNTEYMMVYDNLTYTIPLSSSSAIDIAYGNGKFVCTAGNFKSAYSSDGITWKTSTMPSVSGPGSILNYGRIVYGNGKFVAVGYNGAVAYSTDGITWKAASVPYSSKYWSGLAYGDGKFVATAHSGTVGTTYISEAIYSTDGITWKAASNMPRGDFWDNIAYGNGKFVAITLSSGSTMGAYSTDGITWNSITLPASEWHSIAYGNGKFVCTKATSNKVIYSEDGITWNYSDNKQLDNKVYYRSITYCNDRFIVPTNSDMLTYSEDGITWMHTTIQSLNNRQKVIYGDGKFISIASNIVNCSYDGINWSGTIAQNNKDIADKVKDLVLPISTNAQVGQLLSVKAVDENGKPTEWEAVDPFVLTDESAGTKYKLSVADGKLTMTEVASE